MGMFQSDKACLDPIHFLRVIDFLEQQEEEEKKARREKEKRWQKQQEEEEEEEEQKKRRKREEERKVRRENAARRLDRELRVRRMFHAALTQNAFGKEEAVETRLPYPRSTARSRRSNQREILRAHHHGNNNNNDGYAYQGAERKVGDVGDNRSGNENVALSFLVAISTRGCVRLSARILVKGEIFFFMRPHISIQGSVRPYVR